MIVLVVCSRIKRPPLPRPSGPSNTYTNYYQVRYWVSLHILIRRYLPCKRAMSYHIFSQQALVIMHKLYLEQQTTEYRVFMSNRKHKFTVSMVLISNGKLIKILIDYKRNLYKEN